MRAAASAILFLTLATPVAALEDILQRPESCEAVLTVKFQNCAVTNIYRCKNSSGSFLRHEDFEEGVLDSVSHYDTNSDLIQLSDASGEFHVEGVDENRTPTPHDIVRAGSVELTSHYTLHILGISRAAVLSEHIQPENSPYRVSGQDLLRLKSEIVLTLPEPMPTLSGTSIFYEDPVTSVVFDGEARIDVLDDDPSEAPAIPIRLIREGEDGFESPLPETDCRALSALADALLARNI